MKTNLKTQGTVLIIDDDAFARYTLQSALKRAGFHAIEAETGGRAEILVRTYHPRVVLCSLRKGDGEEGAMVRRLQAREEGGDYKLLLLTSEVDRSRLPFSCEGIDEYLLLPIDEEAVVETIGDYLKPVGEEPPKASGLADWGKGFHPDSQEQIRARERFLRFNAFSLEIERRAVTRAHRAQPPALVHSNQVGVMAAIAAGRMGRATNLNCYLDKGFLPLDLDELQLIVTELVENACRYSESHTGIDVFFLKEDGGDEVYVRDHGNGMTPDRIASIQGFAHREDNRFDAGGEGIGLPMVKLIAEMRRGSFWINAVPGVGTTVRIHLPSAVHGSTGEERQSGEDMGLPPFGQDPMGE